MTILDRLYTAQINPEQFHYETLTMLPWTYFLTPQDVNDLHYIATSKKLAGDGSKRLAYIKQIMEARGFKRFAGGTNRVIYRHLEVPGFVAKIATDQVGMKDNPAEFKVQELIKPFCAKMFQTTPCGTVGFAEKVIPIKNVEEFKIIAEEVFDLLYNNLLGKYVLEDIGTEFFMNYGVRPGFGPVLLDYPYIYELDGKKIFCQKIMPTGLPCGGEIDYDDGFNYLHCKKCGKKYDAVELKKYEKTNQIVMIKGGSIPMKVTVVRGDTVVSEVNSSDIIPKKEINPAKSNTLKVSVFRGDDEVLNKDEAETPKETNQPIIPLNDSVDENSAVKEEPEDESDTSEQPPETGTEVQDGSDGQTANSGETHEIADDAEEVQSDSESAYTSDQETQTDKDEVEVQETLPVPEQTLVDVSEQEFKPVRDSKGRFVKKDAKAVKTSSKTKKVKIEGNFIPPKED